MPPSVYNFFLFKIMTFINIFLLFIISFKITNHNLNTYSCHTFYVFNDNFIVIIFPKLLVKSSQQYFNVSYIKLIFV